MRDLKDGQHVYHTEYGPGEVQLNKGTTAIVRFEHGLEECRVEDHILYGIHVDRLSNHAYTPL